MYYVTMTDKFMSGWGKAPKRNKLIFLCETIEEANIVADNAKRRKDQKYVNVCTRKPGHYRTTFGAEYTLNGDFVQIKTKEDYPNWYKEGYFKN